MFEDPVRGDKNGLEHLKTVRKTHMPIDVLIIMLGTNDLQDRFQMSADAIGLAMGADPVLPQPKRRMMSKAVRQKFF